MKKITLFALMLVGVVTGYAQSAIVGTYNGNINLTHLTGQEASLEAQTVTITETEEGKINVTFPSFAIMTGTELGEFTVEDVAVSAETDGSYVLSKEVFTIAVSMANGMTTSYANSTFSGTIYADGAAEMIVEVKQNPAMALTTAYFFAEAGSDEPAYLGEHKGDMKLNHVDGTVVELGEKAVTVSEVEGKVNVLFPAFSFAMGTMSLEVAETTIENVTVTNNADGSYGLTKDTFNIAAGMMSFPSSALTGYVAADGTFEMKVAVQQRPGMALTTAVITNAEGEEDPGVDPTVFEWGTATWNTEDGVVYDGIAEFNAAGLALTYPNPTGYNLTFLHIIAVEYDVFMDNATEPVKALSTAQAGTSVVIDYPFVEGHAYKLVTTRALLAQANLATYTTDTLTINTDDSYSISFTIKGPELQKTIDVEAYMSLAITDQEYNKTVSKVDVADICAALGINDISEAVMHPLSPNDSYCDHMETFDWWRDADGEFTLYGGGWDAIFGRNAYPAVYCIKMNAAADSVTYYFYDYWTEYVPEEGDEAGGSVVSRAPQTSYNSVIWDWEDEDSNITQYKRSYRVDEGKDYQSRVMYVAGGKSVIVRATLHFVSIEEYNNIMGIEDATTGSVEAVAYYSITGVRQATLQPGINIVRYAGGTARKVYVK